MEASLPDSELLPITLGTRRRFNTVWRDPRAMAAGAYLAAVLFLTVFGGILAPYEPNAIDLVHRFHTPNWSHLLGQDDLGRDVLSRLMVGTRLSVIAGLGAVALALVIALPIGMLAAYYRGILDRIVVAVVDIILSVPGLVLIFALAGILGSSVRSVIIVLAFFFTPLFIRLIRSQTQRVCHTQLLEAERSLGVPTRLILLRHILPNIAASLTVQVALATGSAILAQAALSFLGLGIPPPQATWGGMLQAAFAQISVCPWLVWIPAVAISLTVIACNLLADVVREKLTDRGRQ
jgi:peptide/nickel transport system permease protein